MKAPVTGRTFRLVAGAFRLPLWLQGVILKRRGLVVFFSGYGTVSLPGGVSTPGQSSKRGAGVKFTYTIYPDRNLVDVVGRGAITVGDIVAHIGNVLADPQFTQGMDALIDLVDANIDGGLHEAEQLAAFIRSVQNKRGRCKWAIVAPGYYNFGITKLFAVLCDPLHVSSMPFVSRAEALAWLGSDTVTPVSSPQRQEP
jgi:hypothetical protein